MYGINFIIPTFTSILFQITNHIQSIKQQSKVLAYYFLTSLLKEGLLITQKSRKSNLFSAQGPVRPARKT